MGKYFSDEEIELFLQEADKENPDTIEMYIKVFTNYAWDAVTEIKITSAERGVILRKLSFSLLLIEKLGPVQADRFFIEDLRSYLERKFPEINDWKR